MRDEPILPWGGRSANGQVAEWLMATDCKSVAPCELRRFESSPVHQFLAEVVNCGSNSVGRVTAFQVELVSGRERSGSPLAKSGKVKGMNCDRAGGKEDQRE
jgi:hypothetical protein